MPFAKPPKFRARGGASEEDHHVPVNLAGGELVIPPENLMDVVHPDISTAHDIMDKWVVQKRKELQKTLAKLPGPVRD
jgi:hypothetical protein